MSDYSSEHSDSSESLNLPYLTKEEREEEIFVDTFDNNDERQVALEEYVKEYLEFPFNATWGKEGDGTKQVNILKFNGEDKRKGLLFQAKIMGTKKLINVPVKEVHVKENKMPNFVVLNDYREWEDLDNWGEEDEEDEEDESEDDEEDEDEEDDH